MKSATTAVVIVDDNNDFLGVDGKLHRAVKGFLDDHRVIENINTLMHAARAIGISIVRVPMSFAPVTRKWAWSLTAFSKR
jgi:nicotinamidase-related amidase